MSDTRSTNLSHQVISSMGILRSSRIILEVEVSTVRSLGRRLFRVLELDNRRILIEE